MKQIQIFNDDCFNIFKTIPDGSIDVVLTDPPYLYLKNQRLDRYFDEGLFFDECERVLTDNGFIILFGRGVSFYRWNTILSEKGFNFKEEIIWNKRYSSSPCLNLARIHETVSIQSKGRNIIQKSKIPYLKAKKFDFDSIVADIRRINSNLKQQEKFIELQDYVEKWTPELPLTEFYKQETTRKNNVTVAADIKNASRAIVVTQSILSGMTEKSIIECLPNRHKSVHPTQKPEELLIRLLKLVIPKESVNNTVVFDPFGGSFSTMAAVYNLGCKGISCEIDKEYFDLGEKRLSQLPGKQLEIF